MRGQQCSFHLCLWAILQKKIGMLPPAGMNHFLYANFRFFSPTLIPAGYQKDIGAGFYARVSNPWALLPYTSILHNNLNTEIHFVICGTSPSIISGSMLVWELLHKVPWDGGILVVVVNLDH